MVIQGFRAAGIGVDDVTLTCLNDPIHPSIPNQRANAGRLTTKMAEAAGEEPFVPDMNRRQLMNAILLGSVGLNVLGLAVPYIAFFVPRSGGGA